MRARKVQFTDEEGSNPLGPVDESGATRMPMHPVLRGPSEMREGRFGRAGLRDYLADQSPLDL